MAKVRQDAWSHEDDLLLAETVLRHIREGSTQLRAFEEVGDKLNRTSAACGFRWNAEVRNKYISAIDLAKRQRKEKKRANAAVNSNEQLPAKTTSENPPAEPAKLQNEADISLTEVIRYLQKLKKDYHASNQSKRSLEQIQKENESLQKHISELEDKLASTEKELQTVKEDYQVFIQIMDRARKMTVLEDQGNLASPTFRMDKNGNLQQVANDAN